MTNSHTHPAAAPIMLLLTNLRDPDPDFRFMSLNDLLAVLTSCRPEFLSLNPSISLQCADAIIHALDDANGEVQNLAIRW